MRSAIAVLVCVGVLFLVCKESTAPEKAANVVMLIDWCGEYGGGPYTPKQCCRMDYTLENTGNKSAHNVRPWIKWSDGDARYLELPESQQTIDPGVKITRTFYPGRCDWEECKAFWD